MMESANLLKIPTGDVTFMAALVARAVSCTRRPLAAAGVFAANGGYELVLLLAAAAFALALTGAGRLSVDRALFGRSNSKLAVLA